MKSYSKSRITSGIVYSFIILIFLFALHGFFSIKAIRQMAALARTIHNHPLVVSNAALEANGNILKIHRNMKDVVLVDDPELLESVIMEVDEIEAATNVRLQIVQDNILGDEGQKIAAAAIQLFQEWKPIRDRVIRLANNGDQQEAALITRGEGALHVARLESMMLELTAYARKKARGFLARTEQGYSLAQKESLLLIVSFIFLCIFIAIITIRRSHLLERELAEEKDRLRVTLKSIGDGVITTDNTGAVVMLNHVAENLTGWLVVEAVGRDIREIFNIVNEETRAPCANPVEKILATKSVVGLANHTVLIARNGTEKAIADSGAPIRNEIGEVIGTVLVFRDQSEERAQQNRIIEREKRYRLLADNTIDLIWAMNLDYEFTYVNPAISNLTGYLPEEWVGSYLNEHMSRKDLTEINRLIDIEIAKGPASKGMIFETTILDKNRQPIPVEVRGRILHDEEGRLVGLQGVARDITERQQSEEIRLHHLQLLREMGGIAKIGAWEFNPADGTGTWTDEVALIHDLDPSDATNVARGISFYQGESRAQIEAAIKEAVEYQKPYDLELELVTAKGAHKWVRSIGLPVVKDDVVVQIRGSFQDITEQKLGEQRIEHLNQVLRAIREVNQLIVRERDPGILIREGCRLLVDNRGYASALIILTDENDKPISWGRAGIAASSADLNLRLEQGELPPCCGQAAEGNEFAIITEEIRGDCCGCSIAADCHGTHSICLPLANKDQSFGYLIVAIDHHLRIDGEEMELLNEIAKDISFALKAMRLDRDRRESLSKNESLERQLIQAQKLESVGRLAGGVAHDYNNMIGVIMGNAELALEQVNQEEPIHRELVEILEAAKRSAEITGQLLAFARKQTVAPKILDLNRTVAKQLRMLRRLIGEDIDFAWLPAAGPLVVYIDPVQLDQILTNLCVNARDAISGVGKVTIETAAVSFDEEYCADQAEFIPGDYVMLAISDDGSGMTREVMAHIFEPFFTTKDIGRGTGLGLSTVYGIVRQNNGFINLYSEPDKGTTFRIYLTRQKEKSVETSLEMVEEIPPSRGEIVLLVEDEFAILNLGKRILEGFGYKVLDASTPGIAIELGEKYATRISLLVTDVVMPEMNGRDLADQLKESNPKMKILFMSGYTANTIAHRGVLDEGVNFIQKPFTKMALLRTVREILDR